LIIFSLLRSLKVVELVTSLRYNTGHMSFIFYQATLQLGRRGKTRDRGGVKARETRKKTAYHSRLVDLGQDPVRTLVNGPRWVALKLRRGEHTQSPGRGGTPPHRP
jgi:hypothetical protein